MKKSCSVPVTFNVSFAWPESGIVQVDLITQFALKYNKVIVVPENGGQHPALAENIGTFDHKSFSSHPILAGDLYDIGRFTAIV